MSSSPFSCSVPPSITACVAVNWSTRAQEAPLDLLQPCTLPPRADKPQPFLNELHPAPIFAPSTDPSTQGSHASCTPRRATHPTHYQEPAISDDLPKLWMFERTVRCCSSLEHEPDGISQKSQTPPSSPAIVGTDTITASLEGSGRSLPSASRVLQQRHKACSTDCQT